MLGLFNKWRHSQLDENRTSKFRFYLYGRALIGEGAAEEDRDDVHQGVRHVVLEGRVRVLAIVGGVGDDAHVEEEAPLEQLPHVVGRVDLLHLDLRVDVTVSQEVYVRIFHLNKEWRIIKTLKCNWKMTLHFTVL